MAHIHCPTRTNERYVRDFISELLHEHLQGTSALDEKTFSLKEDDDHIEIKMCESLGGQTFWVRVVEPGRGGDM